MNGQSWKDILDIWDKGFILKYPKNIKKQFFWRTTPINKSMDSIFEMEFVETNDLYYPQDCSAYNSYFVNEKAGDVVSFPNLSKTAQLIVPVPVKGKTFTYIKDFIDNASPKLQKLIWKTVAKEVKKLLKTHKTIWISTHGRGVPCLHIRLDTKPNHYYNTNLHRMIKKIKSKKLSKRAKWRKRIEKNLYNQHKKARDKFGIPNCKSEEIIREGYYRKPYTKKNGNKVKGLWIKPSCIKDRGLPGKGFLLKKDSKLQKPGYGIGPLKKDILKQYGYSTKVGVRKRHQALSLAVKNYKALAIFRRLNAVRVLTKRTNPQASETFLEDMKWFRKKFDNHFKSSWKDSTLFNN